MPRIHLVLAATLLCTSSPAAALSITWAFTGTVATVTNQGSGSAPVAPTDTISGSFTFDSATPLSGSSGDFYVYDDAVTSARVDIATDEVLIDGAAAGLSQMIVVDSPGNLTFQVQAGIQQTGGEASWNGDAANAYFFFGVEDRTYSALSGPGLPTEVFSPFDPAFGPSIVSIFVVDPTNPDGYAVEASVTTLEQLPLLGAGSWGTDLWGQMVWSAGALGVPALRPVGLALLVGAFLLVSGVVVQRRHAPNRSLWSVVAVLLVVPVTAYAITLPHVFTNGTIADADEVNENFQALAASTVPTGAVLPFNLTACPMGWSEFEDASGRTVYGADETYSPGTLVGSSDFVTLTVDNLPSHQHVSPVPVDYSNTNFSYYGVPVPTVDLGQRASGTTSGPYRGLALTSPVGTGTEFSVAPRRVYLLYCEKL